MPGSWFINPFSTLKKTFFFYFRNLPRFVEIVSWVVLPASILFTSMFFWGLQEDVLLNLIELSLYIIAPFLVFLLNCVLINFIHHSYEQRKISTLTLYTEIFSNLGKLFLVLLWNVIEVTPLFLIYFIPYWKMEYTQTWIFLLLIPAAILLYLNSFSFFSFFVDKKQRRSALIRSRELLRKNWMNYLFNFLVLITVMSPLMKLMVSWANNVYDMNLLGNISSIILYSTFVNISVTIAVIFYVVFYYFLYQAFKGNKTQ